jgi:hypothetical protein
MDDSFAMLGHHVRDEFSARRALNIANMDSDALRAARQKLNGQIDPKRPSSICGFTTDNLCTLLDCSV